MSSLLRVLFCFLARLCILRHKPFVIGITGSFGKTTARHIITEILRKNHKDVWTPEGNYNGEWGLALSVLQARSGGKSIRGWLRTFQTALHTIWNKKYPKILVLEYGIDHAGEMKIQTDIVEPDIALFTTLSPSHLEGFMSVKEYYAEKEKILTRKIKNTIAIGNMDDINQSNFFCQFWYGKRTGDLVFSDVQEYIDKTTALLRYTESVHILQTPILGQHHIGLIAGAILVALQLKIEFGDILEAITTIELPHGRGNILKGIQDSLIIDGTYNGGFEPIVSGVRLAAHLAQGQNKQLIALLGDMRELGSAETARHQELWSILRDIPDVQYVFVGQICQKVIAPMLTETEIKHTHFYRDARAAGKFIREGIMTSHKQTIVFAKGSQNTIYLEEALKEIILPEEYAKIVRQDTMYMGKKQAFWKTL